MRKVPKKNYIILTILLICTVAITLFLSKLYLNRNKTVTAFYEYANKIDSKELKEINNESTYLIVYVANKYDKSYKDFESTLEKNINKFNLKQNLVFLEKEQFNSKFIENLEKEYNVKFNKKELNKNIILEFIDQKLVSIIYINLDTDANEIIDYEDLK